MNILYITRVQLPSNAAQSTQVKSMAKAFNCTATNFKLISPKNILNSNIVEEFTWRRLSLPNYLRYLFFSIRVFFTLLFFDRSYTVYTRDIVVSFICFLLRRSSCYEAHKDPKGFVSSFLVKLLVRSTKFKIFCISASLQKYYLDKYKIPFNRIGFYHDGVFINEYDKYRNNTKSFLRSELGLPLNRFIILHTGSLYEGRGIELIEYILRYKSEYLFVQVGGLEEDISKWRKYYSAFDNILFIPHQTKESLIKFQLSADLLFYPLTTKTSTWWCCSPMKIFEYMASGVPVLCANIGSVEEVLNEKNSIPFSPTEPSTIVSGLEFIINNSEVILQRANTALSDARDKYCWYKRAIFISEFLK